MLEIYNKLIRDNLVEHMRNKGLQVEYEILDEKRYIEELNKKLLEEVNEYLRDYSIEEMADIMEVIYAILETKNISIEEVDKVRLEKRLRKGAFKDRIFLKTVEE
ncbi:MAG: phosphoribosyl-ATP pyrophosphohydrolase [Clostridiales bacterium]|nr:phosphoribosyl-ATP pyrophosphohydrolase [Clostridiales bacterium]